MRSTLWLLAIASSIASAGCSPSPPPATEKAPESSAPAPALVTTVSQTVEAACATCVFEMEGVSGCKLAVKVDGKAYLVSGTDMDDHGDAHASDGMCHIARKAVVDGEVIGDRFVASSFKLLPSATDETDTP